MIYFKIIIILSNVFDFKSQDINIFQFYYDVNGPWVQKLKKEVLLDYDEHAKMSSDNSDVEIVTYTKQYYIN